ncbi:MAG TPA: glycosyltransferase family 9 protein [Opitutaceae bacterium]|nr:glycosyltransferase family 9 protein [Opitutaceae bacterium]
MPSAPQSIVSLRPDTIGDIVIYGSALQALRQVWPEARQTLVVRRGYEALAPLFPPEIGWKTAAFNPFRQKPSECRAELEALLRELEALQPDLILAPTLNRTWLEAAVAAHFPKVRSVALGESPIDPLFAAALRIDRGVDLAAAFRETVPADPAERDWENQHRLVDRLAGRKTPRTAPRIAVPREAADRAAQILGGLKRASGGWAAVFCGGLANVAVKAWPAERFGDIAAWLQQERKLPVVLMGHESERAVIEQAAAAAARQGLSQPALWLGRDGELPVLAALLQRARLYVGHDTGAMHLAAAVGRPTIGIFGGGHWPRFRPAGRQSLAVVHPLPCFGCGWDCEFGDGPCVKVIGAADVRAAIERALDAGDQPFDEVAEARNLPAETLRLIAAVTPRYRALQADRLERQHTIEELKDETDTKDSEIAALKKETDRKDGEIASLKGEADTKDREIAALKKETDRKDGEIAALKRAAEERKAESDAKDREIAELKQVCNEREALVIQQDGHIKAFQKMVAELNTALTEARGELAKLESERGRLEATLAKLPPDAPTWAEQFEAQNVHIRNLEASLVIREREAREKDASLANYAAGYHNLEQAKHYSRLLAEKENVIQNLHRACVERQAVIEQLAAAASGPTAGLHKAWVAARAYVRLKWILPLSAWAFRRAVEDYWMQIGILRHYDPRPIAWDEKIPKKPRLPDARLPKVGIVTPSYGQPAFIESTMLSVLNQNYPKLLYVVQDGGSPDATRQIIAGYAGRLRAWESAPDRGQADAVRKGFAKIEAELGPDDLMAWLNSDDFLAPRALRLVAEYFAEHPDVDVVYGHRIIIDDNDREIGRWIMPRHDRKALEWIDYVPQETLFWRKRASDRAGGIDPSFQFALDWDLLARFQQAGCRIVRLPYFLGCFRLHAAQKTSQAIHTTGAEEMALIRARFHPGREQEFDTINAHARKVRFRGALVARLLGAGLRW